MVQNHKELWDECLLKIKQQVTESQYKSFFEPVAFHSYDKDKRLLVLQVPKKSLVEYLEGSFLPLLKKIIPDTFGMVSLSYYVTPTRSATDGCNAAKSNADDSAAKPIATNLYEDYTFDNYIEGQSNKLARSIGQSIAEHPRSTKFNPLFIYGPSGCGKTHLITAIGLDSISRYPNLKVLYVGAREFQRQYVESTIKNNTPDFIRFYQQFNMLIVDDVQEWESSPKTSDTFFHIFNHLFLNRRRIILAADRTPAELKNMDQRMISRFSCGVIAELEKPNHQLCVDILNAKISRDGLMIPPDVVEYIALHANGTVRDLEGVINSLLAFSMMGTGEIDLALAERVCKQVKPEKVSKYDINDILDIVSEHYNVSVDNIIGKSRNHEIVVARQIAMYLSSKIAHAQTTRIGRFIGGRDHSTVKHSIEKIAVRIETDRAFARDIKALVRDIKK